MSAIVESFDKFGRFVKQQAKSNLTKKDKNASSDLYNSINYEITKHKNSFTFSISMEDYGQYVDKGVKGVGGTKADGSQWVKKKVTNNSFKYASKKPPASAFSDWIVRRGFAPRSAGGQFTSRKSMQFAIANSVWHTGLETTSFFSRPFELAFAKLPDEIIEAYGLDLDKFLESSLNN